MEEIELIEKVKQGDMKAFGQLFERYKLQALRTVCLITGDACISEDIVQEAFVKCYLSIKGLKNPEQFRAWFFRMLTRLAWKSQKKAKRLVPTETIEEEVDSKTCVPSVESSYLQKEEDQLLQEEIKKLDGKYQLILILYYYNELPIKEIAKIVGCLEGTVKSRLHTARSKLKAALLERVESTKCKDKGCEYYEAYRSI